MTSSSLKARSRAILIDCYAFAVFASIIMSVLNIVLFCLGDLASFSSRRNIVGSSLNLLISLILFAVSTLLQTGYCFLSLNIARTGHARIRDLFLGFRYHTGRLVLLSMALTVIQYLCAFPLVYLIFAFLLQGTKTSMFGVSLSSDLQFAGIAILCLLLSALLYGVFYLLYDQALFLFIDHQDYSFLQCLRESRRMMYGHRMQLFVLNLSFIGYWVLSILSLGTAYICVKPYIAVTKALFYVELSGRRDPYGI